uniref:Uncharacterized protein n=1 Tax=Arundo donax TaxID=35708 RepID=A0A0A8ZBI8_ARUDO
MDMTAWNPYRGTALLRLTSDGGGRLSTSPRL